jgi:1,4-alpha-glucan branching enzyme
MRKGYLALVLHGHLPFVRHPEYPEFLEEDWLFEGITKTYVPLWQVFERLLRDGVPFRLTMSLTPTLCAMLDDELLRERYLRYLDRAIALSKREIDRTQSQPEINHLARIYHSRFLECREIYVARGPWAHKKDLAVRFWNDGYPATRAAVRLNSAPTEIRTRKPGRPRKDSERG